MAADYDMLDQSQAIAQRLYNDPSIPTIPLDLHTACAIGDYQVVNKCVVSKEDLNKRNKGGWTPLMYAAYVGRDTIVGLLLDGGANTNCSSTKKLSPLMVSAGSGIESVCYFLLQHGANIDGTDIDGCTALLHATRQGQQRTVSLLLDHGANCEIGDNEQITPLMQAAMDGHEIIVELLIGYGAEIHKKTFNGMTAQNMAMKNRHMVIVSMLDNARFRQTFGGASYDSSSSSGASDELMSGPDAVVAKMTNMAASGSFSNDYYKYMESKKNRHSFSAVQTGPRRRLVRSAFSAPEQENPPYFDPPNVMEKLEEEQDPEKTMEAPPPSMQQQRNNQSDQLPSMEEFLSYMGLDKLIPVLQEQEIDLPILLTLDEEDLKRVGVKLFGPRRRLIQAIEQITGKASSATSPATTTTTVNKQVNSPSGSTNNDNNKISDSEQEEHERHQLEEMLEQERNIRTTTEQFALQLQLSRQQANECATTLRQTISDQVIHLTSARKIFTKLSTSLSELNTLISDLKEEVTNSKQLQEHCTEAMKLHTVLGSEMGAVSKAAETMRHKSDELCYHLLSSLQNSQQKQV